MINKNQRQMAMINVLIIIHSCSIPIVLITWSPFSIIFQIKKTNDKKNEWSDGDERIEKRERYIYVCSEHWMDMEYMRLEHIYTKRPRIYEFEEIEFLLLLLLPSNLSHSFYLSNIHYIGTHNWNSFTHTHTLLIRFD